MFKHKIKLAIVCILPLVVNAQTGLFMRTQFLGSQLDVSWLYFTSDKKMIRNPQYGANPLQIAKETAKAPGNVASYALSGNKMSLKWADGKSQTVNVGFNNGSLTEFDGGIVTKAAPFTFETFPNLTYSGMAIVGSVARSVTFFFGKDGRFTEDRLGSISGSGTASGAAASTGNAKGTYSIVGNTIIFQYSDRGEWRVLAQPYDMGNEEIIINDQLFKKR